MHNVLLRFLRESKGIPVKQLAQKLQMSVTDFRALERGEILMRTEHAQKLGKVFKIKPEYIEQEAQQLDMLLTRRMVIKILKNHIEKLKQKSGKPSNR